MVGQKGLLQRRNLRGNVHHMPAGSVGLEDKVVICVVPGLHGLEGVPVVGVLQSQNHGALGLSPVHKILQSHFQSHLHCHTAGVGKEAVRQFPRKPLPQLFRQLLGRRMGQATQHNMGKPPRLVHQHLVQGRMLVAVDHAPPGGDGVNHPALPGVQIDPLRIDNLIGCLHGFHLLVGIPNHRVSLLSSSIQCFQFLHGAVQCRGPFRDTGHHPRPGHQLTQGPVVLVHRVPRLKAVQHDAL